MIGHPLFETSSKRLIIAVCDLTVAVAGVITMSLVRIETHVIGLAIADGGATPAMLAGSAVVVASTVGRVRA